MIGSRSTWATSVSGSVDQALITGTDRGCAGRGGRRRILVSAEWARRSPRPATSVLVSAAPMSAARRTLVAGTVRLSPATVMGPV